MGINAELLKKYESNETVKNLVDAKESHPDNITAACFKLEDLDAIDAGKQDKFLACLKSGADNKDSGMGCYAMNPNDYDEFGAFFADAIATYHKVPKGTKHINDWSLPSDEAECTEKGIPTDGKLDLTKIDKSLEGTSMRVRVGRNLKEFPLPGAMTADDRKNMENKLCEAFEELKKSEGGGYNSLTPGHPNFIDEDKYNELVKAHIMFKNMDDDPYLNSAGISSDWPIGRGCYVSEDKGFIIWVGEEDHMRIMCMKKGNLLNDVFDRLKNCLDKVESIKGLEFAKSDTYGYVTSCPTNLGTGMRASVHIKVPNLTSDGSDAKAKAICKPLGLSVRGLGGEHTAIGADGTIDLSPSARFAIKESQIVCALYQGIKNCLEAEQKAGQK